jgi:hypothetical protein
VASPDQPPAGAEPSGLAWLRTGVVLLIIVAGSWWLVRRGLTFGPWLAAACTLAIYSILYRENVVFRLFEHIFIGLATGYGAYVVITQVIGPKWWVPMSQGNWYWVFAPLTASLFYFVYSRRLVWMNRLVIGGFMGLGAGLGIVGFVTELMPQLSSSFKPILLSGAPYLHFNNLIFALTLVTVMSYFFFSVSHRHRGVAASARVGRWMLMVAFGAIFGNTVMGRMSLFIDRAAFLLFDFLRIPR